MGRDGNNLARLHEMRNLADGGHGCVDPVRLQLQAWPTQHLLILGEHGWGDVERDAAGQGE
jgi:hypothetical protein